MVKKGFLAINNISFISSAKQFFNVLEIYNLFILFTIMKSVKLCSDSECYFSGALLFGLSEST